MKTLRGIIESADAYARDKHYSFFRFGVDVNDGRICLATDVVDKIVTQVIDTQEREVRKALVSLGWTPPDAYNDSAAIGFDYGKPDKS